MKKIIILALVLCVVFVAMCGCNSGNEAKDETFDLKVNWENSPSNFMTSNWDEWCKAVTEKSQGKIKFTTYYDCTLLDPNAEMQQLQAGIADIADAKRLASEGFVISENWKLLTAGIPAEGHTSLSYDFCEKFPEVMKEFEKVKVLAQAYTGGSPYQLLTTKKAVATPSDMTGLTIWCEPDWNEFVKACGGTPVNTPWSEVYSSLQKNMYDGLMIPVETMQSCNFAEVCNYVTFIDLWSLSGPGYYMNLDTYNKLPDDLKAIIDDKELIAKLEKANYDDGVALQDSSLQWAIDNFGTTAIYPTKEGKEEFNKKLTESKEILAKKLDEQGLPGTKMVETITQYAAQN